jgi:predicted methyltransferase
MTEMGKAIQTALVTVLLAMLLIHPAIAPAGLPLRVPGALFDPVQAWLLQEPSRDEWQRPKLLLRALDLQPGDAVADIGAGSGYMMPHLSGAVGPSGQVYAQDVQPEMVSLLRDRSRTFKNVSVARGRVVDPCLPPGSVNAALLLTSYHELAAPVALLSRLLVAMRPGGRLVIVDFDGRDWGDAAPRVPFEDRVPEATVTREAAAAGWRLVRRVDGLPYQYCLVFEMAT